MALILKHASASRPSGEWRDDDYDVLAADGLTVGVHDVTRPGRRVKSFLFDRSALRS
jgi:hypothetical protein